MFFQSMDTQPSATLWRGRFLEIREAAGRWEYAARTRNVDVVMIFALAPGRKMLIVEEFRPPLGQITISAPAGLCGDQDNEEPETAARRELLEETGYAAETMRFLFRGPSSPGLTSETVNFFLAGDLHRIGKGGGIDNERIAVREIPLDGLDAWLERQMQTGKAVDPRIYTGVHFLAKLQRQ